MGRLKEAFTLKPETPGKIKVGIWSLIGGAIIAIVVGFNWGGWETAGAAKKLNDEAVLKSQATICAAQFMEGVKYKENLTEIQKLESWSRADFITKGGWDKMPGQKEAGSGLNRACAEVLQTLLALK